MSEFDHVKNIQKMFDQKSLLDVAIEVEKFLDFMNLYVYPNWFAGEIVDGPNVGRYWITLTLRYDFKKMPDPMGARILHDVGVKVNFRQSVEMDPIEVKSPNDFRANSKKPKLEPKKIWYVELKVPRRFIDEIDYNDLEDVEDEVEVDDIADANDKGIADDEAQDAAPLPTTEQGGSQQPNASVPAGEQQDV
jgi:hypothetical protein